MLAEEVRGNYEQREELQVIITGRRAVLVGEE
jgi:hypothetical protein